MAIWLAFFPVSLIFNYVLGPLLGQFELLPRIMISTLILTPLMVFWFIPLSTHLLSGWLNRSTQMPIAPAESASTR